MTAWASWQFREFVFHVTKNVNTASKEEGNLYTGTGTQETPS